MTVLKQVLGIDVAQKELVVSLGRMLSDLSIEIYAYKVFKNNEKGFILMLDWLKKLTDSSVSIRFVMEATGVYHEKLAYFLDEKGFDISIILPNKISNYFRTLETKTITDKTCSEAIASFGLERKLDNWHRPKVLYRNLKQLTRERDQIVAERVMVKNQLHAENAEAYPNENSLKRLEIRLNLLNQQEKEIKHEIADIVKEDEVIKQQVENITTIPGVGALTAVIVLAETNGFELIRNKRQLVSYAGLDVREKLSGTSIKGKPRISKKGNKNLRRAMHLPSLSAVKRNEHLKALYVRIVSCHGIKMKGLVAVQRKLLELIYVIYKNNTVFEPMYESQKVNRVLE